VAAGKRKNVPTAIPISVVETLPDKFKPAVVTQDTASRLQGSFDLPKQLPSLYTITQLMRTPKADLRSVYEYVFDLAPSHFAEITGAAGIEYELVEFVLDAIIDQHGKRSGSEWRQKALGLKQGLENCERYDVASLFVSSDKVNIVEKLLSGGRYVDYDTE
jgi:hypothetical protein